MATATKKRVIPADVYDAMEFGAEVFGGIGAGEYNEGNGNPCCAIGMAWFVAGVPSFAMPQPKTEITLRRLDIFATTSDSAVFAINARANRAMDARVPFADWCAELNVERGK